MMSLTSLAMGVVALATGALAFPFNATELEVRQALTSSSTGTNGGYYYSFWNAGGGTVTYTNKAQSGKRHYNALPTQTHSKQPTDPSQQSTA